MFERTTHAFAVARAFLLAEKLKNPPPTDREKFRVALAEERRKLAELPDGELLKLIDADRRARFEKGAWVFAVINLDRCSVRPGMGGEQWARGPVHKIASQFPSRALPGSPTRGIREFAPELFAELPLVLIRTRSDYGRYRIEDGSHRAVAYYLAGFRQAFAYVARVPSAVNLTWRWEG